MLAKSSTARSGTLGINLRRPTELLTRYTLNDMYWIYTVDLVEQRFSGAG